MPHPLIGVGLSLLVFAVLMVGGALARRRGVHPELSRKAVHVGMGAMAITYPWLFDQPWPVIALSLIGVTLLVLLRSLPPVRDRVGGALHDVQRRSVGELAFPLAVATTFVLAGDDPFLYWIPITFMTVADAAAALVGVQYGRLRFTTGGRRKSTEGSLVFFLLAFLATHLILLLATDTPRVDSVLIGLTLGALVMVLEAVSRWGIDNFLVPVGAALLLADLRSMPSERLLPALLVTLILVALVLLWRKKATLNDAALLAAAFYGYVAWSAEGLMWMVAPLILFLSYTYLAPSTSVSRLHVQSVAAVLSVTATGSLWLWMAHRYPRPELLFPYTLGFAAHLAIIVLVRLRHGRPTLGLGRCVTVSVAKSWVLQFVPYLLITDASSRRLVYALGAVLPLVLASWCFARWQPCLDTLPMSYARWFRQTVVATAASCFGWIPLYLD